MQIEKKKLAELRLALEDAWRNVIKLNNGEVVTLKGSQDPGLLMAMLDYMPVSYGVRADLALMGSLDESTISFALGSVDAGVFGED